MEMIQLAKHIGAQPEYETELILEGKRYLHKEERPDGSVRYWTEHSLQKGCGETVEFKKDLKGLIFCHYCDRWFNPEQFQPLEQ